MKKYNKPTAEFISMETESMLATSGGNSTMLFDRNKTVSSTGQLKGQNRGSDWENYEN